MRPKKEILREIDKASTNSLAQAKVNEATVELLADLRDAIKEGANALVEVIEEMVKEQRTKW